MSKYAFGIDIGGTTVKMGLFSAEGEMIESWEIPTRKEESGAYILPDIAKAMEDKMTEKGFTKEEIIGVNIPTAIPLVYEFDDDFNVIQHY